MSIILQKTYPYKVFIQDLRSNPICSGHCPPKPLFLKNGINFSQPTAIASPNLLGQVAKGRESEAKNNLGAVNRAQQAYRVEKGVYGTIDGNSIVGTLPLKVSGEYYDFSSVGGLYDPRSSQTMGQSSRLLQAGCLFHKVYNLFLSVIGIFMIPQTLSMNANQALFLLI